MTEQNNRVPLSIADRAIRLGSAGVALGLGFATA
jgi:hypothetical protein